MIKKLLTFCYWVDRLAQSYQHFINKYCGGNKNIVLDQMKEYAECFRNNLKPNQCGMSIPKEEGIERINVVIFGLKNTTMIPYILYIAKNVQDKNELNLHARTLGTTINETVQTAGG